MAALTRRIDIVFLATLAYLPALASSPGRMPGDTKLYLYTDPAGLVQRAASTFEPDQFAGWVPHQQITYLWPSGPWFWFFDAVSVPDWVAHRLWIGSILFAAGVGALRCARHLGHVGVAALTAAAMYQLSPYVLPYISRTSLLLLPWAGLGWIIAATIRATRDDAVASRLGRWRDPAVIALIVATIGSTNATALAMIVPGPALWILLSVWRRDIAVRRAAVLVGRVTAACVAVSMWWIAMLVVQSRSGAPVLLYSETLEDVSRNATAPEVFRAMGYWLFYGRDAFAATTTSSLHYLTRSSGIAISFAVSIVGLIGIGFGRGAHRQLAGLLVLAGTVLAVGVHPADASSPLMRLLTGDAEAGLALALRSSTRAVPVVALGLALGAAALVERASLLPRPRRSLPWASSRRICAAAVVLMAFANMPSLWRAELVDPALDRDSELPAAWTEAAAVLDTQAPGTRVLQLPGAEFGAFDWGYTVDQPLVSATDLPLVTRDLLPLGSAPTMDLLYALDDRVQTGTLEPRALAPLARLFGVSTIWIANDLDGLRFRTPPAGSLDAALTDAAGLGDRQAYGAPAGETAQPTDLFGRPLVDADVLGAPTDPVAPVVLVDVDQPEPIVRVKTAEVVFSGSGEGIVDAASAGLIDGTELLRDAGSVPSIGPETAVIVTDSNRDRARHWRSSQDVVGHTEPGGPDTDVLVPTAADQRLDPRRDGGSEAVQTVAVQRGPVTAIATAYGEPFAYRPEDRAVMAIDGDPATAWRVGDHGDPVGDFIRLTPSEPIESLTLHQAADGVGRRTITSVGIDREGAPRQHVEMDASSIDGTGQIVQLTEPTDQPIDIVITGVTVDAATTPGANAGVGFSEIETGLGPTVEYIRPPTGTLGRLGPDHGPLDIVLTRDRVEATSFWRTDPEPVLRRLLPLSTPDVFDVTATIRLDQRASDAVLATLIGDEGAIADRRLPGLEHRGASAVDADQSTAWLTPVDEAVGATLAISSVTAPIASLDIVQPTGLWSTITEISVADGTQAVTVSVPTPDASGRSVVALPQALGRAGAPVTITITAIVPSTVIERRYGDTITMPAGIAELSDTEGIAVASTPGAPVVGDCDLAPLTIDGASVPMRFETTTDALLAGEAIEATLCADGLDLAAGEHTIVDEPLPALTLDRVVLSTRSASVSPPSSGSVAVLESGTQSRVLDVDCPAGCWLVFGMGFNTAWRATTTGGALPDPEVVDGGFNGWWIAPTDGPQRVTLDWTAQRPVTLGLAISLVAAIGLSLIVLFAARRRRDRNRDRPVGAGAATVDSSADVNWIFVGSVGIATAVLVAPIWGVVAFVVTAADLAIRATGRRRPILAVTGTLMACFVAVSVLVVERRDAPFPNPGWTDAFSHLHGLMLTALVLVAASTFASGRSVPSEREHLADQGDGDVALELTGVPEVQAVGPQ